jgi:hypothetical protein
LRPSGIKDGSETPELVRANEKMPTFNQPIWQITRVSGVYGQGWLNGRLIRQPLLSL